MRLYISKYGDKVEIENHVVIARSNETDYCGLKKEISRLHHE